MQVELSRAVTATQWGGWSAVGFVGCGCVVLLAALWFDARIGAAERELDEDERNEGGQ